MHEYNIEIDTNKAIYTSLELNSTNIQTVGNFKVNSKYYATILPDEYYQTFYIRDND